MAPSTGVLVPPGTPAGLYHGTTSTGRQVHLVYLEEGTYWLLYTPTTSQGLIAGVAQGHASASNGAAFSNDFRDFNFEGQGISNGLVSASYFPKQFIRGKVVFPSSSISFDTSYDIAYEASSLMKTVSGTYTGTVASVASREPATLTVSSTGAVDGISQSGCRFAGTATTHSGWVYDVTITFAGAPCVRGAATVTGVAYYDAGASRLYAGLLDSGRADALVFAGAK